MSTQFALDLNDQKNNATIKNLVNKARRRSLHIEGLRLKDQKFTQLLSPVKLFGSPTLKNSVVIPKKKLPPPEGRKLIKQSRFLEGFIKKNMNLSIQSNEELGSMISKNVTNNSLVSMELKEPKNRTGLSKT